MEAAAFQQGIRFKGASSTWARGSVISKKVLVIGQAKKVDVVQGSQTQIKWIVRGIAGSGEMEFNEKPLQFDTLQLGGETRTLTSDAEEILDASTVIGYKMESAG